MNLLRTVSICGLLAVHAGAAEPGRKRRSTVPKSYPAIIQMTPPAEAAPAEPGHEALINSGLEGRAVEFFKSVHETGQVLLALASLGGVKAGSEQITAVAKSLQTTQTEENKQVARLAEFKGVKLSPELPPAQKKVADDLVALAGPKFEKAWMERLISANEAALASYQAAVAVNDSDIKSFATNLLPLAKAKLELAKRLAGVSPAVVVAPDAPK